MTIFKLTYFNFMGRAELIRLIFAAAGIQFEDNRIGFEEWVVMKKDRNLVYGLPVLEVDGKTYFQSLAITNYLARKFDLYGKTPEDQMRIDQLGQCFHDIATKLPVLETDPVKKKEIVDKLFSETFPPLLRYIEDDFLTEEGGCVQYVIGDFSVADIGEMRMVEALEFFRPGSMSLYPKMAALAEKVRSLKPIAEYLKSRPVTEY